jgi:hypothetical protein
VSAQRAVKRAEDNTETTLLVHLHTQRRLNESKEAVARGFSVPEDALALNPVKGMPVEDHHMIENLMTHIGDGRTFRDVSAKALDAVETDSYWASVVSANAVVVSAKPTPLSGSYFARYNIKQLLEASVEASKRSEKARHHYLLAVGTPLQAAAEAALVAAASDELGVTHRITALEDARAQRANTAVYMMKVNTVPYALHKRYYQMDREQLRQLYAQSELEMDVQRDVFMREFERPGEAAARFVLQQRIGFLWGLQICQATHGLWHLSDAEADKRSPDHHMSEDSGGSQSR